MSYHIHNNITTEELATMTQRGFAEVTSPLDQTITNRSTQDWRVTAEWLA